MVRDGERLIITEIFDFQTTLPGTRPTQPVDRHAVTETDDHDNQTVRSLVLCVPLAAFSERLVELHDTGFCLRIAVGL